MNEETERIGLIFQSIRDFYHKSPDYNGIEFERLRRKIGCSIEELATDLYTLVIFQLVTVVATSHYANPHIKQFENLPGEEQYKILNTGGVGLTICLYPTEKALIPIVGANEFNDRPFTRRLHLGEPQLRFYTFELNVLASYQDDPRYLLDFDGINGQIYLLDEFHSRTETHERDKIYLQTFGLANDKSNTRAIAVYLRYLAKLSPEHQQMWYAKIVVGDFQLHPDYYRQSILGEWEVKISVFRAFIGEIQTINEMCVLIEKARLFRHTYKDDDKRPPGLEPLYRSTAKAYYDFAHLIDKILSDDIDRDFFRDELNLEEEVVRKDHKIEVRQKGTIRLLKEWLNLHFQTDDSAMITNTIAKIRKIRQERQYPAHKVLKDEYDPSFFAQHQSLMTDAYDFVHNLRLMLATHPKVKSYTIPEWLIGDVQTF